MRLSWVLGLSIAVLTASACLGDPAATNETACATACNCATDAFAERTCNRDCISFFEQFPVVQECLDCIADLTCPIEQNACNFECGGVPAEEWP